MKFGKLNGLSSGPSCTGWWFLKKPAACQCGSLAEPLFQDTDGQIALLEAARRAIVLALNDESLELSWTSNSYSSCNILLQKANAQKHEVMDRGTKFLTVSFFNCGNLVNVSQ